MNTPNRFPSIINLFLLLFFIQNIQAQDYLKTDRLNQANYDGAPGK